MNYYYILDPPCHHSCPESLSEMCSTSVHSEKVDIAGKTIECEDLGFSIAFPPGAVISPVTVSVCCSFKQEFSPPNGYQFVSPVYILHVPPETQFLKKVTLSLQHWAKSDGSDLRFASCPFPNLNQSYPFEVKDGDFTPYSHYGRIEVGHFSVGVIIRLVGAFSWLSSFLWGGRGMLNCINQYNLLIFLYVYAYFRKLLQGIISVTNVN